ERWKYPTALRDVSDAERRALVGPEATDVAPLVGDAALRGRNAARDGLEQRRLAGAVGADERDELTGADLERHLGERAQPVVRHAEPADRQHPGAPARASQRLPRYASITAGLRVTSAGAPSASRRPRSSTPSRAARPARARTACS